MNARSVPSNGGVFWAVRREQDWLAAANFEWIAAAARFLAEFLGFRLTHRP